MKRVLPWLVIVAVIAAVTYGAMKLFKSDDTNKKPDGEPVAAVIPVPEPVPSESELEPAPEPEPEPAPLTAADVYDRAVTVEEEQGAAAAVKGFESVIQMDPDSQAAAKAALKLGAYYQQQKMVMKARDYYNRALKGKWSPAQDQMIRDRLTKMSNDILMTPAQVPETLAYTVKAGDSLSKIAKKYKITAALLKKINNLKTDLIRIDDQLKVIRGPFAAIVDKSDLTLTVTHGGKFFKQYAVGLGKNNSTPVGSFSVKTKLVDPDWYTPEGVIPAGDPANILGTRWMGLRGKFGIHGTTEPESIGKYSSNGCIRMLNKDAEEVYNLLVRKHSKVTVRE